jgi:hypothetical protein
MIAGLKAELTRFARLLREDGRTTREDGAVFVSGPSVLLLPREANVEIDLRALPEEWHVLSANSIEDAVSTVISAHVPVVLCFETPMVNWREAVLLLSGPPCSACVIVISSTMTQASWDNAIYLGGYDLLPKAIDSERLVSLIRSAWSEWKNSRALESVMH